MTEESAAEASEVVWIHRFILVLALLGGVFLSLPLAGLTTVSRRIRFIPITGVYILIGITISLVCSWFTNLSDDQILHWYGLDPDVFLFFLLPPIIFAGTINIQQYHFFRHFVNILSLSILGTLISTGVVTYGVWYLGQKGWFTSLNIAESIAFGGLISATDPVAALSVFSSVGVDERLFSLVVGEALFNDAVGIVIFNTARDFFSWADGTSSEDLSQAIFSAVVRLALASVGSVLTGFLLGLLFSFILKIIWYFTSKHGLLISILFWLCGYISFIFGQTFGMSGIIVEVFCVLTLRHYGFYNLPSLAKLASIQFSEQLSIIVETLVYIQIGTNIVIQTEISWFTPAAIVLIYLGRAVAILVLLPIYNLFIHFHLNKPDVKDATTLVQRQTSFKEMIVIWFVGQRGPVALSLALTFPGTNSKMILATTVLIIMHTIYVHGIPIAALLESLGLVHLENRSLKETRVAVQLRKLQRIFSKQEFTNTEAEDNENIRQLEEEGHVASHHGGVDTHRDMVQQVVIDPLIGHGLVAAVLAWDIKYVRPIFTIEPKWRTENEITDIALTVLSQNDSTIDDIDIRGEEDIPREEDTTGDLESNDGSDHEDKTVEIEKSETVSHSDDDGSTT